MYYAIEIVGYRKRRRFVIKKVISNGTYPINFHAYETEAAAKHAAKEMGIKIQCTGEIWHIINKEAK